MYYVFLCYSCGIFIYDFLSWRSFYLDFFFNFMFSKKQGNSVARDLPPIGSEANTTIFILFWHPPPTPRKKIVF